MRKLICIIIAGIILCSSCSTQYDTLSFPTVCGESYPLMYIVIREGDVVEDWITTPYGGKAELELKPDSYVSVGFYYDFAYYTVVVDIINDDFSNDNSYVSYPVHTMPQLDETIYGDCFFNTAIESEHIYSIGILDEECNLSVYVVDSVTFDGKHLIPYGQSMPVGITPSELTEILNKIPIKQFALDRKGFENEIKK